MHYKGVMDASQINDANNEYGAEYAQAKNEWNAHQRSLGFSAYGRGLHRGACINSTQRKGWDEARGY